MQGACLFFIWLTLQSGLMVQNTVPDRVTGNALLVVLSVANLIILVSPVIMCLIVGLQIVPTSIRRQVSTWLGMTKPHEDADAVVLREPPLPPVCDAEPTNSETALASSDPELLPAVDLDLDLDFDSARVEMTALRADAAPLAELDAWDVNPFFAAPVNAASGVETTPGPSMHSPGSLS